METAEHMTILIIDDKPANIYSLEKMLEKEDRTFLATTSGREGLRIALEKEVDLIILDVQMPEMDGFEVAQLLKSNKRTRDIPIIFASAEKKERQSMMKGFEEGAVDYLSKPLDPELTRAKVSVLLQLQKQKKELQEKNQSLEEAELQIRNLNKVLQNNLAQLEAGNKELESFTYSVSHDLRAPLRSISGYSTALAADYGDRLDEEGHRLIKIIVDNAARMNQLIDDLLKFSRLGRKEPDRIEVDFNQLVQALIKEQLVSAPRQVIVDIHDLHPGFVDASLIRQVWTNLISNAIKYSSKTNSPRLEIGCHHEPTETVYYIKDNGTGFDMKYADKLFGVFQRLHSLADFEGTGVGLALVKRIVVKHGGRVWATGKPREGATFFFSIPKPAIE